LVILRVSWRSVVQLHSFFIMEVLFDAYASMYMHTTDGAGTMSTGLSRLLRFVREEEQGRQKPPAGLVIEARQALPAGCALELEKAQAG
jgi:hypothetical protein